ncbi:hypothetical protein CAOG_00118 [Capsaspora owczarzaki ATCC 30864]|uniref:Transmembrane protein n=1 Tax=Capsaspora owczarzaki (strain ATCC 30864) TaxID=595528 RepID=A0A0D2X054_CAPO3|nr:hypothetical protein CAOG_00118 [Capsaspora owczarzaki ATCC 30864]KJE88464.1 hypothetical protein CAOG_000118 [Capsaspora owczarzaki ATCC 30864]|eukprot:XP_004364989.1 hypothetical protein CAOG_00118 [Capsaspora owczarzaki ATCC 30864]
MSLSPPSRPVPEPPERVAPTPPASQAGASDQELADLFAALEAEDVQLREEHLLLDDVPPQNEVVVSLQLRLMLQGAWFALLGSVLLLTSKPLWIVHRRYALVMLLTTVGLFVALHLLIIPFRIVITLLSLLSLDLNFLLESASSTILSFCRLVPFGLLLVMRYGYMDVLDNLFFIGMDNFPRLKAALREERRPPFSLRRFIDKKIAFLLKIIAALLLSLVPYVGPAILFFLQYKTVGLVLGRGLGLTIAFLGVFVPLRELCWGFLYVCVLARAISWELLAPYHERVSQQRSRSSGDPRPRIERSALTQLQQDAMALGFGIPIALLLHYTPYGWVMFGLLQASAAYLVAGLHFH